MVPHVTDVVIITAVTERCRNGEPEEHVGSHSVEVLEGSCDTTSEEVEVHTGIHVGVCLPSDVLITLHAELDRRKTIVV